MTPTSASRRTLAVIYLNIMWTEETLINLSELGYSQLWINSGVLTIDDLTKQIEQFKTGDDTNKEHYRYKTFCSFISQQSFIDNYTLQQLIEILEADEDRSMSGSATIELLKKKYLTNEQFTRLEVFLKTFGNWAIKYIDKIRVARLNQSAS